VRSLRRAVETTVTGLPREFWWLWAGTLVNRAGAFVLPFLAIYLTRSLDYSTAYTGVVLGGFGLGSMAASIVAGVLADRLGRRPVLLWSQVATALTLVALGFSTAPATVLVLTALFGFCSNASRPAYSAMMADIVLPADRVRAFSLHYWAVNLGFAVAAVLAGLLASSGYLTLFLVDAATTLTFAVLVYLRVPESHPAMQAGQERPAADHRATGSLLDVARDGVFMAFMLLTFAFAVVFMQHLSTLPVQMSDDGLAPAQYGVVIALNAILIVLVTVPMSRWLQRFPASTVLALSGVFVGIGFGATAWATSMPAYALTVVVWTIGELIGSAVGPAVVADLSPASMRGRYQGTFTFTFGVAAFVAPVAGGWVYDHWGGVTLWLGCGIVSLAAAAGHVLAGPARSRRLEQLRAAEHSPTTAVPVPGPATPEEADEAVRQASARGGAPPGAR
jgi:MFS family permease